MMRRWMILTVVVLGLTALAQPAFAEAMAAPGGTPDGLRDVPADMGAMPDNSVPAAPAFRPDDPKPKDREEPQCKRGGCSGELCLNANAHPMASTCMWRPEFECYSSIGTCEMQPDGKCGWTMSSEMKACLASKKMGGSR